MTKEEVDAIVGQLALLNQILAVVFKNVLGEMSPEVAMEEVKRLALTENKEK
jgi:hypothetical protein